MLEKVGLDYNLFFRFLIPNGKYLMFVIWQILNLKKLLKSSNLDGRFGLNKNSVRDSSAFLLSLSIV